MILPPLRWSFHRNASSSIPMLLHPLKFSILHCNVPSSIVILVPRFKRSFFHWSVYCSNEIVSPQCDNHSSIAMLLQALAASAKLDASCCAKRRSSWWWFVLWLIAIARRGCCCCNAQKMMHDVKHLNKGEHKNMPRIFFTTLKHHCNWKVSVL